MPKIDLEDINRRFESKCKNDMNPNGRIHESKCKNDMNLNGRIQELWRMCLLMAGKY